MKEYKSFKEFYPFYLSQHENKTCRWLHFIGTILIFVVVIISIKFSLKYLLLAPVVGYGFAWAGHFIFEKNRPATFKYPLYSLIGDFVMFFQMLTRRFK